MTLPNAKDISKLIKKVGREILIPTQGHKKGSAITNKIAFRAEETLRKGLQKIAPHIQVYDKDSIMADPKTFANQASTKDAFVITPLSGATAFTEGCTNYGIMVAYIQNNVTHQGYIFLPAQNLFVVAQKGQGLVFAGTQRQICAPNCYTHNAKIALEGRESSPNSIFNKGLPHKLARCSSAQYYIAVIKKNLDAAVFTSKCAPWYNAAGDLAIQEGGGGSRLPYSNGSRFEVTPTEKHDCIITAGCNRLIPEIRNYMREYTPDLCRIDQQGSAQPS